MIRTIESGFAEQFRAIIEKYQHKNVPEAQKALDRQIMKDMTEYMPKGNGAFIEQVKAVSSSYEGQGKVCASTGPMAHFLYNGIKYYDPITGKGPRPIDPANGIFRWRKDSHPEPNPANIPLTYSNGNAEPEWFEAAKRDHFEEWKKLVERIIINGK